METATASSSDTAVDSDSVVGFPTITPMVDRQYRTVLADPPWPYDDNCAGDGRGAESHYETMSVEQIAALGGMVNTVTDAHSHLYLWTTNSFIDEAFDVVRSWGFTPKTVITWVKTKQTPKGFPHERDEPADVEPYMGMGHYYRNSTEHCVFATKSNFSVERSDVRTHFYAARTDHSSKPQKFYDLVETQSEGPFLEMFARAEREGWYNWGKET